MKNFLYIYIICVLLFSANGVHSFSYSESLPADSSHEQVDKQDISRAKLLQRYVERYKSKVNNLYKSYDLENSAILGETNITLDDMSQALRRIQKRQVNPDNVGGVMERIINDIALINGRMEERLRKQKNIFDEELIEKKKKYIALGKRIRTALTTVSSRLTTVLSKREQLNEKEKALIRSLARLRDENDRIRRFQDIPFSSEEQMKNYFEISIRNIKREIGIIRSISR